MPEQTQEKAITIAAGNDGVTREGVLAVLGEQGYAGEGDLESVTAFLAGEEVVDENGNMVDLAALWEEEQPAPAQETASLSPKDLADIVRKSLKDEMKKQAKTDRQRATEEVQKAISSELKSLMAPAGRGRIAKGLRENRGSLAYSVPASVKRQQSRCFKGENGAERAYRFGMWALGLRGNQKAANWCKANGLSYNEDRSEKAYNEGTNSAGGALVPDEFDADLIKLVLEYGVFRRNARVRPMSRDTLTIPRHTGRLSGSFAGEASAVTASNSTYDNVTLTAKKYMVLGLTSSEVSEDAAISLADDIADDVARQFAYVEDDCGFNGTGTSTYGGINGVRNRLTSINGVDDGGGLVLAAGNAWSEIIVGNLTKLISVLPTYARAGAKFFCHQAFAWQVMHDLAIDAGGNSVSDFRDPLNPTFMGYPIEFVEVMPSAEANSQVCLLFGNLQQSSSFGDRRQRSLMFSEHASVGGTSAFDTDQLAFRATQRFDIVNHNLGSATVAGAAIGLITASG